MRRSIRVLLAASLLANVFAAGVIGGGLFMLNHPATWRSLVGVPLRPIRAAGDELPAPDRERFRNAMRQVLMENRDLQRTARQDRRMAKELFVAPEFDAAAVSAKLDQAREADMQSRARLEAAAVAFAQTLQPDERALLAQGLQRGGPLHRPLKATADPGKAP